MITLDLTTNSVRIDDAELTEQFAELYALLVEASSTAERWLVADDLKTFGRWQYKRPGSVGKEVRRHVVAMKRLKLDSGIESPPRASTRQWRLVRPEAVVVVPENALPSWIAARRQVVMPEGISVPQVRRLMQASLAFRRGHMEQALDWLGSTEPAGRRSVWDAWQTLLEARARVRVTNKSDGNWDEIRSALDGWKASNSALGNAMAARLSAVLAYGHRSDDVESGPDLNALAALLEHSGDLASLATVINVRGLLLQRSVDRREPNALTQLRSARRDFERAAGLFGFIGDAWSLQAALFNSALALRHELALQGQVANDAFFEVLGLSLDVCDAFHVGDDSIQAEALGARAAWDAGRRDLAETYFERAVARGSHLDSDFEQGVLAWLMGRRAELQGDIGGARRYLASARAQFVKAGDLASVAEIERDLAKLKDA